MQRVKLFLLEATQVSMFKLLPFANVMLEQKGYISLLLRCKYCNVSLFVWVGPMPMIVGYR